MEWYKEEDRNIIREDCFYDIIGDVHGNADELEELFLKLGYSQMYGVWRHTHRKAIFVGDFINRGPKSRRVLEIVKGMVQYEYAHAILGNHELNAIYYCTRNSDGRPIKRPSESSRKFIEQVKSEFVGEASLFKKYIKWLRTLPIHLDFGHFRVVHAYWNDEYVDLINQYRTEGRFKKSTLKLMVDPDHPLSIAIRQSTKGIEFNLPNDLIIKDSTNTRRNNFRIKWWESPENKTFYELSYGNKFRLPDYTIPKQLLFPFKQYMSDEPLVFFGHYCMSVDMMNPQPNICCVDSCIASGGLLTAYRWKGEQKLISSNFVFVNSDTSRFKKILSRRNNL